MKMLNKQELKYIIFSAIFVLVWFVFILPYVIKKFDGNSPLVQFIFFNLGIYVFFFIFLKTITLNSTFQLKNALGFTSLFIGLDIIMPEYHVLVTGELIKGGTLGLSTSDYLMGLFAQSIGLNGILVYIFTYVLMPVVFLLISAKLLPNFVRRI